MVKYFFSKKVAQKFVERTFNVVSLHRRFRADALSAERRVKSEERQAIFDFLQQQFQGAPNWRKSVF